MHVWSLHVHTHTQAYNPRKQWVELTCNHWNREVKKKKKKKLFYKWNCYFSLSTMLIRPTELRITSFTTGILYDEKEKHYLNSQQILRCVQHSQSLACQSPPNCYSVGVHSCTVTACLSSLKIERNYPKCYIKHSEISTGKRMRRKRRRRTKEEEEEV